MSTYHEPDTFVNILHNINLFDPNKYLWNSLFFPDKRVPANVETNGHLLLLVYRERRQNECTFHHHLPLLNSLGEQKKLWTWSFSCVPHFITSFLFIQYLEILKDPHPKVGILSITDNLCKSSFQDTSQNIGTVNRLFVGLAQRSDVCRGESKWDFRNKWVAWIGSNHLWKS